MHFLVHFTKLAPERELFADPKGGGGQMETLEREQVLAHLQSFMETLTCTCTKVVTYVCATTSTSICANRGRSAWSEKLEFEMFVYHSLHKNTRSYSTKRTWARIENSGSFPHHIHVNSKQVNWNLTWLWSEPPQTLNDLKYNTWEAWLTHWDNNRMKP